ncbi:hypothetical protein [Lysinibacillus pakistanensis]|uniref:Uncharacterized protein n=1 Tax=Lysinibacillus pakistanensis TaxID=759811 RepID=A0ABX6DCS8_9BACI|nr:hypothetical protein GDS87_10880 [Lysinibacillus pakistanensis]
MNRPLEQLNKDIQLILSNKLNSSQSFLLFLGITLEILLRKDLFKKNSDLQSFIEVLYIPKTKKREPFKEYLYLSRTQLAARLNRIIIEELNYSDIIDISKKLLELLPSENTTRKGQNTSQDDAVSEWMNFLDKKGANK